MVCSSYSFSFFLEGGMRTLVLRIYYSDMD